MKNFTISFPFRGKERTAEIYRYDSEMPPRYSVLFNDPEMIKDFGEVADYYEIDQHIKYNEGKANDADKLHAIIIDEIRKIQNKL